MTRSAQPRHVQGVEVVEMVHLAVRRAAKQAGLLCQRPMAALFVGVSVGPTIVFEALNVCEWVGLSPRPHVGGVAACAVGVPALMGSMAFATGTFGHGDLPGIAVSSGGSGASTPSRRVHFNMDAA